MAKYKVKYLVVGGYAVMRYTEPRFTKALDLWISTDEANAQSIFNALAEFGAPLDSLTPEDFSNEGYYYQMGSPPFRLDIMMSVSGIEFNEAWSNREILKMDELSIPFIGKSDLIKNKVASGRLQDLLDAENLKKA